MEIRRYRNVQEYLGKQKENYAGTKYGKSERKYRREGKVRKENGQWKESLKEENIVLLKEGNIVFLGNRSMKQERKIQVRNT